MSVKCEREEEAKAVRPDRQRERDLMDEVSDRLKLQERTSRTCSQT